MPKSQEFDYHQHNFGDLRIINSDEVNLPRFVQTFLAARSNLCPVPIEVLDNYQNRFVKDYPDVTNPQKIFEGALYTAEKRYNQCNFVLKDILSTLEEKNLELHINFLIPVLRKNDELPKPNLNAEFLPRDFKDKMNLASTPYGYALPRIFLLALGGEDDIAQNQKRYLRASDTIERLALDDKNYEPIPFVVKFAEKVSLYSHVDPKDVLKYLVSKDILAEEGCKSLYREVFESIAEDAPHLNSFYQKLLKQEGEVGLREMGIIAPSDLE